MDVVVPFCGAHDFFLFKLKRASNRIYNSNQWNEKNVIHVLNGIMRYDFKWNISKRYLNILISIINTLANEKTKIKIFHFKSTIHYSSMEWDWNSFDSIFKSSNLSVIKIIRFEKISAEHLFFTKFPLKFHQLKTVSYACVVVPTYMLLQLNERTFKRRTYWPCSFSLSLKVFIFAGFSYDQESNTYTK